MATETTQLEGWVERDWFGNRIVKDYDGLPQVVIEPIPLAEWRANLKKCCQDIGWNLPQIDRLEGSRLFQLTRLLREAGGIVGIVRRPAAGSIAETLSGTSIIPGMAPTREATLDHLKKTAESLQVECSYNDEYVKPIRDARIAREEAVLEANLQAERGAAEKAEKKQAILDGAGDYRR